MDATRVEAGAVISVNPGRRELRVRPLPAYRHEFESMEWLHVASPGGGEWRCRIHAARRAGDAFVLTLGAGTTRDHVAAMRGARVLLAPEECTARPEDDWQLGDLLGMRVTGPGNAEGEIVEVFETPANAAFAVRRPDGSRFLLPAIPEVVELVDLDTNTVHLGPTGPYMVDE